MAHGADARAARATAVDAVRANRARGERLADDRGPEAHQSQHFIHFKRRGWAKRCPVVGDACVARRACGVGCDGRVRAVG